MSTDTHRCAQCGALLSKPAVRKTLVAGYPDYHYRVKRKGQPLTWCGPVVPIEKTEGIAWNV